MAKLSHYFLNVGTLNQVSNNHIFLPPIQDLNKENYIRNNEEDIIILPIICKTRVAF